VYTQPTLLRFSKFNEAGFFVPLNSIFYFHLIDDDDDDDIIWKYQTSVGINRDINDLEFFAQFKRYTYHKTADL
jgi:hypothetical protein